jgi:hypothetical protein
MLPHIPSSPIQVQLQYCFSGCCDGCKNLAIWIRN